MFQMHQVLNMYLNIVLIAAEIRLIEETRPQIILPLQIYKFIPFIKTVGVDTKRPVLRCVLLLPEKTMAIAILLDRKDV